MIGRELMDCRKLVGIVAAALLIGCTAPREPRLVTDHDPSMKIPAIASAVQNKDLRAAKQMVADLDSDDPAVRFYAIQGLQRLTGQTFDYSYYANDAARAPAVERWRVWLASRDKGK